MTRRPDQPESRGFENPQVPEYVFKQIDSDLHQTWFRTELFHAPAELLEQPRENPLASKLRLNIDGLNRMEHALAGPPADLTPHDPLAEQAVADSLTCLRNNYHKEGLPISETGIGEHLLKEIRGQREEAQQNLQE